MLRKLLAASLIVSTFALLATASSFAAKPNKKPTVTAFDVPATSSSPVPINTFTATDQDGTVVGYLVTESSATPGAGDPGWTATAPAEYTTASTGAIILYAWAKDDKDAVSDSMMATVNIPEPPTVDDCVATVALSGAEFTNIQAAIDSFASVGPDNRCLVKVMPGTYNAGSPIQMREYVDLQGSGEQATVIKANLPSLQSLWGGSQADPAATVRMASHSCLRDLSVINDVTDTPDPSGAYGALALFFDETADACAEGVTVEAKGPTHRGGGHENDYHAVFVQGTGADVTLDRVTASYDMAVPQGYPFADLRGDNAAIGVWANGKLLVKNSRAVGVNAWWNIGIVSNGYLTVENTSIEVSGIAEGTMGILAEGITAEVHGATIAVDCHVEGGWPCAGINSQSSSNTRVHHADIKLTNPQPVNSHAVLYGVGSIAASGLDGALDVPSSGWTIVNCWDGNFLPVQN